MKDQVFGVLQRIGRSFMLPIALLPAAGLLLGIGGSFSNVTMLKAYGLTRNEMTAANAATSFSFFAIPIATPMAKRIGRFVNTMSPARLMTMNSAFQKEKEVAALAAVISFLEIGRAHV